MKEHAPRSSEKRARSSFQGRPPPAPAVEGEESIIEFFGQLWAIDSPPPPPPWGSRVSSSSTSPPADLGLFWIRKELVEKRNFTAADCFPAQRSDRIESPVRVRFSEVWSRQQARETYAEVLKRPMEEGGRWVWQPEPRRPPSPPPRNQRVIPPGPQAPPPPQQPGWQGRGPRQAQGPARPPPPTTAAACSPTTGAESAAATAAAAATGNPNN